MATCAECKYWRLGGCRRFPPTVTNSGHGYKETSWPNTNTYDWCGEFEMKGTEA